MEDVHWVDAVSGRSSSISHRRQRNTQSLPSVMLRPDDVVPSRGM